MDPPSRSQRTSRQKRPMPSDRVDDSDDVVSGASDFGEGSSLDEWLPSSIPSASESTETTSEAGDKTPQRAVVARPPGETQFSSWEELERFLATYRAESFQIFRARTNTTVAERNAIIENKKSKAPRIPEAWEQYARTFVCTHYGKYESKGTGKRPRQESRAQGCKAKINACVQVVDKSTTTFAVRITRCVLEHNHKLSDYAFKRHPSQRVSVDASTLRVVNELRKAGAKKVSILRYLRENSSANPTSQDAHNLVRKLKAEENANGPTNTAKRLKKWMKEFCEVQGNVGRIFVDDLGGKKVATCITLQTKHMRSLFRQFPEVLLMDATHGTNRSKYKVFSFMAHDTFGKGQFVQHALLQNERWATLLTAMEEFKNNNPEWTKLRCILIDKDFTEISVLKEAFPDVTVLLCQFHVIKYLREEVASADYRFTWWQKEQLRGVMNLLVYAKTELEYKKHFEYMKHLASLGYVGTSSVSSSSAHVGGFSSEGQVGAAWSDAVELPLGSGGLQSGAVGQAGGQSGAVGQANGQSGVVGQVSNEESAKGALHPFVAYFLKNWDNCREMWCAYKRQNTVTLGNNTNNRLEATWKQLKEWSNSFMSVDECIASIMCYQNLQEDRFMEDVNKKVQGPGWA